MFTPFSDRAKPWEKLGLQLRRIAGVQIDELLDPWQLARKIGLHVFDDIEGLEALSAGDKSNLLKAHRSNWSAGVYPEPLPDGAFLCILNPTHIRQRQKISLMEEVSHRHLGHRPSRITFSADGICIRDFDPQDEEDAYGVGAAALLPWQSFFPMVNRGLTGQELREHFDVSLSLIEYRIKVTGLMATYNARQRKKFG